MFNRNYESDLMNNPNRALQESMPTRLTYRQELLREIESCKNYLAKKQEMLRLLDENPAIEKFMDLSR